MAKKLDDDLFEDVPYEVPEMDDSLFEDTPYYEPEEMSTLEAMARGASQGLTFDFADELIGAGQAAIGKMQGEGDYSELYKKYRDIQRKQMEQAAEESPIAYYGSDIAAGVIPALFTGGASAAAGIGKAVAKGSAKSLGKQALKAGAIGAGMGAVTGAGVSEAEVLDGDISGLAKDAAIGTISGAVLGAATPALTKAGGITAGKAGGFVKEVLEAVPGVEAIQKGYKAGTQSIKLSQEGIRGAIKKYAEDLHSKMVKKLTKEGMDKKNAIEIADELGVRVDAGEAIEAVMKDLSEKGAVNLDDLKDKKALYTVLEDLVNGNDQTIKAIKKLEVKTAKQAARDKYAYGAEARTTRELEDEIPELLPLTEEKGVIKGLEANMRIPSADGTEATEYAIRNFIEMVDGPIKLRNFDINNLKPSDVEDIIATINKHAGDLTGPAKGPVEKEARRVASMLRDMSNKALDEFDVSSKNASITNMLRALRKTGIKGKLRGSEEAIKDQIDKIRKKISATGESSEIDKERMFEYLEKVGPEFSESIEQGKFLNELNKLSGMTEGVRTTNIKGLVGTAEGAVAKLSNLAGRAVRTAEPVTKVGSTVANKVMDTSDDVLIAASNKMLSSSNKALAAMGQQLEYALQQEGSIRNALLWSLSQQPAFRREVQKIDDSTMQGLGLQEASAGGGSLPPEGNNIIPLRHEQEEEEKVGRNPASHAPIVEEEDLDSMSFEDAFNTHYDKVKHLPLKERPNLIWKGAEYVPKKKGEEKKDFFKPQTKSVNMDVDQEVLDKVEKVSRGLGYKDMIVSSGRRDVSKTMELLKSFKKQYGLDKFNEEDQSIIDKLILRGDSPDSIEYANRADVNKVLSEKFPEDKDELIQKFKELRSEFGGLQSPHLQGKKIDIPYSYFIKNYGQEEGIKKVKEFIKALKDEGLNIIDEEKRGVIDIQASKELEKNINSHSKYINSGGSDMYSSTGDRLIGSIDDMPISEEQKDEAKQAVLDGNIPYLRDMMSRLKGLA